MGLVDVDVQGNYVAVMPVPLRRKWGVWRVHQPFFCQMLGVFSRSLTFGAAAFYQFVHERFQHGSVWQVVQCPTLSVPANAVRQLHTQVLDLSNAYPILYARYTPDRRRNLRRAQGMGWQVREATDIDPLVTLFQQNHAHTIDGGVSNQAYGILRNLYTELQLRGMATLLYAERDGQVEAGTLFVQDHNRIIYLFNAATEAGRRGNARTWLIDQHIQKKANQRASPDPMTFDFESPEKPAIQAFYASFGTVLQPYWSVRWSRLSIPERGLLWLLSRR